MSFFLYYHKPNINSGMSGEDTREERDTLPALPPIGRELLKIIISHFQVFVDMNPSLLAFRG